MKVNVLTESSDWILARAAGELLKLGYTINGAEGEADIDYYLPYLIFKKKKKNIQIGYFTHLEHPKKHNEDLSRKIKKFEEYKNIFDYCVAISDRTKQQLKRDCPVIKMGSQFKKQIIFGVCGKVHASGRKNEHFIAELVKLGFGVISWGEGWPCPNYSKDINCLEFFYKHIDYLIVPSSIEGGPVPVLEAISLGVPVIAPDVGWCWDYPVIRYERDDFESLHRVVKALTHVRGWDDWRNDHKNFFESIWKSRN